MLFTLLMPTILIPLVGLGIDATMCYIVQAKLGSAVDGAALGAGRLLGTLVLPAEIANEFLSANFRAEFLALDTPPRRILPQPTSNENGF